MSPKPKNTPHRVLLSLPTDLYNTISRVSAAMEKPRAEIIRELLANSSRFSNTWRRCWNRRKQAN
jgi:metal-responsive CopG/Arc/MetJ family transcriptional regulator